MLFIGYLLYENAVCFGDNIFHCTVVEVFICSSTLFGGFSGEKEVDKVRISRKLYFPADEVSRKRNFPTIPQTSTLLFLAFWVLFMPAVYNRPFVGAHFSVVSL